MRILWFHLLILAVVSTARNIPRGPSFPDDLYPANLTRTEFKSKCPRHSDRINDCAPRYEECTSKLSSSTACESQFCSCVEISDTEDNEPAECYDHNACGAIRINGNEFRERIIENERNQSTKGIMKKLKPLLDAHNRMVIDCGIESELKNEEEQMKLRRTAMSPLLNLIMPFLALNNIELPKTEKCENARLHYLETFEDVDDKTSRTLKIPYNMWFFGAEFGPMGRVITRIIADQTCDKSSAELNHHSVSRVNCYDQQRGRDKCDKEFFKSGNRTLSTLDSKKVQCKMFVEFVEGLQSLRSDVFYKEAAIYNVDASKVSLNDRLLTEGFKADNQSLTQRDTKTTIVSFESTERFSPLLQQYFDRVSSECSNSRNIVASCGFRYGQCILQQRKQCQKQLTVCLSDIPEMSKSCEEAYQTASDHLWPSTPPTQEPEVEPIKTSASFWSVFSIIAIITVLVVLCAILICRFVVKLSCLNHTEQIFSEDEDHSTTIEKRTLLDSETSSSGSGTNTPNPTSDQTPPNAPDSNENVVPDNVSIQSDTNCNNSNIPVIQSDVQNNHLDTLPPMKYEEPVNM